MKIAHAKNTLLHKPLLFNSCNTYQIHFEEFTAIIPEEIAITVKNTQKSQTYIKTITKAIKMLTKEVEAPNGDVSQYLELSTTVCVKT